jgi:pimeloyl-ACP methyl ester carboxylesterase
LDASHAEDAVLFAVDFSGLVTLAFAAKHPQRIRAVVVFGGFARLVNGGGDEASIPESTRDTTIAMVTDGWGDPTSLFARLGIPGDGSDRDRNRDTVARIQRLAANPTEVEETVTALFDLDVTPVVEQVRAPVLLLHRTRDRLVPVSYSRYLALIIPRSSCVSSRRRSLSVLR